MPPADRPNRTKNVGVASILLLFVGIAMIGVQAYVLATYDDAAEPLPPFDAWRLLYNGLTLATGCVTVLVSFYGLCLVPKQTDSVLTWGVVLGVISLAGAVGATAVSSYQADRLSTPVDGTSKFFALEISASALAGLDCLLLLVYLAGLWVGLRGSKKPPQVILPKEEVQKPSMPPTIVVEPVVPAQPVEEVEMSVRPPSQQEHSDLSAAYLEQIRQLSREELEYQLEHRLQKEFMHELRRELDRRKRLQQSDAYYHAQVKRENERRTSHQPQPDYF